MHVLLAAVGLPLAAACGHPALLRLEGPPAAAAAAVVAAHVQPTAAENPLVAACGRDFLLRMEGPAAAAIAKAATGRAAVAYAHAGAECPAATAAVSHCLQPHGLLPAIAAGRLAGPMNVAVPAGAVNAAASRAGQAAHACLVAAARRRSPARKCICLAPALQGRTGPLQQQMAVHVKPAQAAVLSSATSPQEGQGPRSGGLGDGAPCHCISRVVIHSR